MSIKEKAMQILNTFSEEQLVAFVVLFGGVLNIIEPPAWNENHNNSAALNT